MCRLLHQARTRLTQRPGGTQGLKALNMSQREQLTAAGACFLLPPPITLRARAAALPRCRRRALFCIDALSAFRRGFSDASPTPPRALPDATGPAVSSRCRARQLTSPRLLQSPPLRAPLHATQPRPRTRRARRR